MARRSPVFDSTLNDYLAQVTESDWETLAGPLGIEKMTNRLAVPVLNRQFFVAADGVTDAHGKRSSHSIGVLLCRYILLCPGQPTGPGPLVTYKDFKNAAPFVGGFRERAERPIAVHFTGRAKRLEHCCRQLGGMPFDTDAACQLAYWMPALPRVPVYLMFNDANDEFSAGCTLLFRRNADRYLDMECLAILGDLLAAWLLKCDIGQHQY